MLHALCSLLLWSLLLWVGVILTALVLPPYPSPHLAHLKLQVSADVVAPFEVSISLLPQYVDGEVVLLHASLTILKSTFHYQRESIACLMRIAVPSHSHSHLSLVLVVMMKSKELKTKISHTHSLILSYSHSHCAVSLSCSPSLCFLSSFCAMLLPCDLNLCCHCRLTTLPFSTACRL